MSAYMIFKFDVSDVEIYSSYVAQVGPILIEQGADVLVVSDNPQVLEGSASGMNVIIKFGTEEKAMIFYDSPEYAPLKTLRAQSTTNSSCVLAPSFTMPTR